MNPKADKDTAIYMFFRATDGPDKYYIGQSIHPDNWDSVHQTAAGKAVRAVQTRTIAAMEKLETDCRVLGRPMTWAVIRETLDRLLNKNDARASETVFPAFEWAVAEMYAGNILTVKEKPYSHGTVRTIENAAEALKAFRADMRFDQVSMDQYRRFIVWCNSKEFTRNYTGTLIKNWKALMRATEGKYHQNTIYKSPEFKKLDEAVFDIYLDEDQKKHIYEARLPPVAGWETTRAWFILGCYLGLRVSDLLSLTKKNLTGTTITIVNEKTDERVVIPLHPVAKEILTKHKGFPPRITPVELNRTIKLICSHLKMNATVIYSVTRGGKRQDIQMETWQMISSHTMRRSAVTNLLAALVPENIVMKITGIKSHATLRKYNKLSADKAAQIAAGLDYFKQQ